MTALDLPRFTDEQMWTARSQAIRNVADLVTRARITETDGHTRVTRLAHWSLNTEAVNAEWEQLIDAEKRLARIRSDGGGRDDELAADWDAIHAIKRLAGPRP
jgi:hypothetical protein